MSSGIAGRRAVGTVQARRRAGGILGHPARPAVQLVQARGEPVQVHPQRHPAGGELDPALVAVLELVVRALHAQDPRALRGAVDGEGMHGRRLVHQIAAHGATAQVGGDAHDSQVQGRMLDERHDAVGQESAAGRQVLVLQGPEVAEPGPAVVEVPQERGQRLQHGRVQGGDPVRAPRRRRRAAAIPRGPSGPRWRSTGAHRPGRSPRRSRRRRSRRSAGPGRRGPAPAR